MSDSKRIAVVVLNWNGADLLEPCVSSLMDQSYKEFTVVVVDNGSTDESKSVINKLSRQFGEKLIPIFNGKNLGFAGGVNAGIKYAIDSNFFAVALFNNDAIADKNWLNELADGFSNGSDIGAVTGLLLDQIGEKIDSTGDWYSIWGAAFPRGRDELVSSAPKSGYVFGGTGGATLYKTEMLREIGLFDENFFAYYEDVDLSFRAQLRGWKFYYQNTAIAYHKRGVTSDKIPGFTAYQSMKNIPMLYVKNVPLGLLIPIGLRLFVLYLAMLANRVRRGRGIEALKGFVMFWRYLPSCLIERSRTMSGKKATTSYIRSIIYPGLPSTEKFLKRFFK